MHGVALVEGKILFRGERTRLDKTGQEKNGFAKDGHHKVLAVEVAPWLSHAGGSQSCKG